MTVTVTNLSFGKGKKKKKKGKSSLFYSGGAQPENSILRQQWRGKYLSKDQRWQRETHYKTMAACLPAWLPVRAARRHELPRSYLSRERKGDRDTHHHLAPHRRKHWCE